MTDYSEIYRRTLRQRQSTFQRKYRKLFDKVAQDIGTLSTDPNIRFTKSFTFARPINARIDYIINRFHDETLTLTQDEIAQAWGISNEKNDLIVRDYIRTVTAVNVTQEAGYYLHNMDALKAFIGRERSAQTLSGAIWKVALQTRAEMEIHLGLGVLNGDSSQVISQRIRQYLNNPDALFRRVRDANGNLVASEAMRAFRKENNLSQGTYTSAYKNAMRVARSETNAAYHASDNARWSQLDMVIGIKISLSGAHPDYNFPEICELLVGVYPKDFVWEGWHPHCLCHRVPIMTPSEDFLDYLTTGKKKEIKPVTEYPEAFKTYASDNYERFMNYKSKPYWFEDNASVIQGFIE